MADEPDSPRDGETLEEYLWRHGAHPDNPNRREMTDAEIAAFDKTEECLAAGLAGLTIFLDEPREDGPPPLPEA